MRIFFIGTVRFSYNSLKALLESGEEIVGVATKANSVINADYEDLDPLCRAYNIPCKIVNDINHPNNIEFIKNTSPDVIYCFGWSNLLKSELLFIPPKGIVGFHPAKIPYNRGRHPIIWALCLGLKTTAASFFFMDEEADTGDILSQVEVDIYDSDDANTLYERIVEVAIPEILLITQQLKSGLENRLPQDKEEGNAWRKRSKRDGEIDFRMSSKSIYNLVRALTKPYVGAHIFYNGQDFKVWSVEIVDYEKDNVEPGKILMADDVNFIVKTADGAVKILKHEFTEIPKIGAYL